MITRLPSNQHHRDAFWSKDPAFRQLAPDADDAAREAHARKWRVAEQTGNYGEVLIGGATPTKFIMQPIRGDVVRKLVDRGIAGRIGVLERAQLAFRAAVVAVENFGDVTVKQVESEYGPIAELALANLLDECAPGCVNELGSAALDRALGLSGE